MVFVSYGIFINFWNNGSSRTPHHLLVYLPMVMICLSSFLVANATLSQDVSMVVLVVCVRAWISDHELTSHENDRILKWQLWEERWDKLRSQEQKTKGEGVGLG